MLITSCNGDIIGDNTSQIVVEGWIDNGAPPTVYVTKSVPVTEAYNDFSDLSKDYIIRDATIYIVNDKDERFLLQGTTITDGLIDYCYTCNTLKGNPETEYTIEAYIDDTIVKTKAKIPSAHPIDTIYSELVPGTERYRIIAHISNISEGEYGRFFVSMPSLSSGYLISKQARVCLHHTSNNNSAKITITKPDLQYLDNQGQYFAKGDTVSIRFSMMTKEIYDFWDDYDGRLDLSRNMFFPLSTNLDGTLPNVKGYWAGYNSTFYNIVIGK